MKSRVKQAGELGNLPQAMTVADVVRAWPRDRGLVVVCGGGPVWRRSMLAEPSAVMRVDAEARTTWGEGRCPFQTGRGVMEDVGAALRWGREHRPRKAVTGGTGEELGSGWIASFSYGLGEVIEPAAARKHRPRRAVTGGTQTSEAWPLVELWRVEEGVEFDHESGRWTNPPPNPLPPLPQGGGDREFEIGALRSEMGREAFERAVERGVEYIRAGDVFQVNLAHRLRGTFSGSARAAFAELWETARPWHGAYLEDRGRALLSMSPELFLKTEGGRVMTRPMKGTRAGVGGDAELLASGKDAAELAMIVDLMRNDLGRVCRFGSVRVVEGRGIELHGGGESGKAAKRQSGKWEDGAVWQGVGTVVGELREGMDLVDLLSAAFPAGSVTGAPKIRAMQIIDELEACERGPYCGSIGWIGDDGRACLNVAIRTAEVFGGTGTERDEIVDGELRYSVGAGIVAESEPRREWEETLEKAGVISGLAGR